MCVLAIQKLQDVEKFSITFLNYDLLAQRWMRYGYIYPLDAALAGVLVLSGALIWIAPPVAIVIGSIGAISAIKAVYLDKRELKCACTGDDTNQSAAGLRITNRERHDGCNERLDAGLRPAQRITVTYLRLQRDALRRLVGIGLGTVRDDLRRAAADLVSASVHRGQFAR